jgi:hypothetical protein
MSDGKNELTPIQMDPHQKAFVIKELAVNTDLFEIKSKFDRFFNTNIKPQAIMQIGEDFKNEVVKIRYELYSDLSNLPLSFEYNRIALSQSRIKHLLENKTRYVKTIYEFDEKTGEKVPRDIYETDEASLRAYLTETRNEAYAAKELMLKRIINKVDGDNRDLPVAGFKPVVVNVGLTWDDMAEEEESSGSEG